MVTFKTKQAAIDSLTQRGFSPIGGDKFLLQNGCLASVRGNLRYFEGATPVYRDFYVLYTCNSALWG